MANLLVLYKYNADFPMRAAIRSHLYCFRRWGNHRCYYFNLAFRRLPRWLSEIPLDLVILQTSFFEGRENEVVLESLLKRAMPVRDLRVPKVAIPQDDYVCTDQLCRLCNELHVDFILSAAPPSEWKKIYHSLDWNKVRFSRVLPGYLDEDTLVRIAQLPQASSGDRPIDIGYRSRPGPAYHGRHGLLKSRLPCEVARAAKGMDLVVDISTQDKDVFYGDDWFRFLLRCKYMPGVEGGASVLDADGSIFRRTRAYLREHPEATFEEIEAACFPGADGTIHAVSISPRHLEACATRTCQILVEGSYNGILQPGVHYLELRKDFSNLPEILETVRKDQHRQRIVENAYRDIVASGLYTYSRFVEQVVSECAVPTPAAANVAVSSMQNRLRHAWISLLDRLSWVLVLVHDRIVRPLKAVVRSRLIRAAGEDRSRLLKRTWKRPLT